MTTSGSRDAVITDGIHIGKGAVIAAGAVVTRDVAPHTLVGGCRSRVTKIDGTRYSADRKIF